MSMTAGMPMPFLSLYKISVLLYSTVDNMCNVCLLSVSRIRMDLYNTTLYVCILYCAIHICVIYCTVCMYHVILLLYYVCV